MFKEYITKLINEKSIDLEDTFVVDMENSAHVYEYGEFIDDLVEITKNNPKMRNNIRKMFVRIEFLNADIKPYIVHLATGIVKQAYSTAQ